jgi:beta-galactosidase
MEFKKRLVSILGIISLAVSFSACVNDQAEGRSPGRKEKFDFDWKFSKGDFPSAPAPAFDDGPWQKIDLPHDWSILDAFSKDNPTGKAGGFASGGIGWYRKTFRLSPIDKSSTVTVEFGGVYENSEVWINGNYLGKRPYGYISFNYDLTPYLNFQGDNLLAVRVDNSKQPSARWYTGCGIYRHVWLIATNKLHIARHGVYATTTFISADSARITLQTTMENDFDDIRPFGLASELYSAKGELVARAETSARLPGKGRQDVIQNLTVPRPELWSPDVPSLYKLKTVIRQDDKAVDELETSIGIREFRFSADSGFSLNGKSMKFRGVCNHGDLGALGAALNDRVLERRLDILKAMGCNAIRTAHYPPPAKNSWRCATERASW